MVKEIRLRKIPDELFIQLEMMSEKFQYSNLSDFLMSQLYRIVESYGSEGRAFYIQQRWTFDLIWPIVYFSFIFSVSALLYQSIGLSYHNRWILSFSYFAILFDYLENIMVTIVMARFPSPTFLIVDFAGTMTSLKWIFLVISFFVLAFLTIIKLIQIGLRYIRK